MSSGQPRTISNWRKILEYFDSAVQIGMTATPLRDDNIDTYSYFGRPLVVYSLRQGISDGYLAPYRVRRVLTDRVEEEEEAETLAEGHEPEPPGDKQEPVACESSDEADEEPAIRLESSAAMVARTDVIAAHLARKLRETDTKAKTIVFCVDQEHARLMLEALEREFPAEIECFKARGENYIERIVSDEGADGKRALGKFSDSEKDAPVIVTTSKLLSTGVDMPPCKNIVIARPIGSIVEFKQIIGRGTRLDEPHKMWFTIIDYAGTTKHFYDPEFDGDPQFIELDNLNDTNESASGEETGGAPRTDGASSGDSGSPSSSAREATPSSPVPAATVPAEPGDTSSPVPSTVPTADDVRPPSTEPAPALPVGTQVEPSSTTGEAGDNIDNVDAIPSCGLDGSGPLAGQPAADTPEPRPVTGTTDNSSGGGPALNKADSPTTPGGEPRTRPRDGVRIAVVGEFVYELGPDGRTLRQTPYLEYTKEAIGEDCSSLDDLRERWLRPELRTELQGRLADAGVELEELAAVFNLADRDPIDIVAHALFRQPVPTRRERIERLKERHLDWLIAFEPDAREVLDLIIEKYIEGEANDVTDTGLLKVPPLSQRGTFVELAQRFGNGAALRDALAELSRRLYQD